MKEKYEKPNIETEKFAVEMMNAACTCGPEDVEYGNFPFAQFPQTGKNCDCPGCTPSPTAS